jgi:hypothetical protein
VGNGVFVGSGVFVCVGVGVKTGVGDSVTVGVKVGRLVRVGRGVAVGSARVKMGSAGALQANAASTPIHNSKLTLRADNMNSHPLCLMGVGRHYSIHVLNAVNSQCVLTLQGGAEHFACLTIVHKAHGGDAKTSAGVLAFGLRARIYVEVFNAQRHFVRDFLIDVERIHFVPKDGHVPFAWAGAIFGIV